MMPSFISATIVIPCFNEERRLKVHDFRDFITSCPEIKFIFVDDGSSDNTFEVLNRIVAGSSSKIVRLERNGGKAEAVRRGMIEAVKSDGICGFWDADLATPLNEILLMIAKLQTEDFHCVIGSRWLHLGDTYIKRGCFRHITGRFFATCISFYLDLPVYDSQCGAKLFSAEAAKIVFQSPFATRWLFDVEIIKRLQQYYGKKTPGVLEFPVSHWEDTAGSQISVWQVMNDLLKLWKS
jgi:glycosyltransferase involved in cell wall biosynthesis